jgi:hypothetical protein
MRVPSASIRLMNFISHHVSRPRLRHLLLTAYQRARALRHAVRRIQGRSRRVAQRAARVLLIAKGRAQRRALFVVVSAAGPRERASSMALIKSIQAAVVARLKVEVLFVDFVPDVDSEFAAELERGRFPAQVTVRRFWRDATPGAGLAKPRHTLAGLVAEPAPKPGSGEWQTAYYRSGIPVLSVDETSAGRTVEYYGPAGEPVRRDEIDAGGRLIRIVDVHPDTGHVVTHRYPMGDDTCWLSVWVDPESGTLGPAHQHLPAPREFASLRAAQAHWVDEVVSRTARPILIAAELPSQQVLQLVEHTSPIRRALAGEVTAAQWRELAHRGRIADDRSRPLRLLG